MRGSFNITCVCRTDGSTAIGPQAISAPWHLSKPYWDGEVLLVQAVNATAGIFAGDQLTMHVVVESGASVLLTSPSASRIHTMPQGEATLLQQLRVESGGWLEWMPELFIPQRDCRYRQTTDIDLAAGASAYLVETLAPGRVAHGEAFAFDRLVWNTRIRLGGRLVMAERYPLSPGDTSIRDLKTTPPRYFANAFIVSDRVEDFRTWQQEIGNWNSDSVRIGGTQLAPGFYLIRLLAGSSDVLKETLARLRSLAANILPHLQRTARKL